MSSTDSSQQQSGQQNISLKPFITKEQSALMAQKLFAIQISPKPLNVKELGGYDDANFLVKGRLTEDNELGGGEEEEQWFVLKVTNSLMSKNRDLFGVISSALDFISSKGIQCPVPVTSIFGNKLELCRLLGQDRNAGVTMNRSSLLEMYPDEKEIADGILLASDNNGDDNENVCVVRMLTFVHGKLLCDVPWTNGLLFDLGVKIARLHKILKEFTEANQWISEVQQDPHYVWELKNVSAVVSSYCHALDSMSQQNHVQEISRHFQTDVLERLENHDCQLIHGDLNDQNIIVGQKNSDGKLMTQGFIDFSDIQYSYRVLDFAMAVAYIMIESARKNFDVIQASGHVFAGYQSEFPLEPVEIDMLLVSAKARICQSLVLGAYQYKYSIPGNAESATAKWKVLEDLRSISDGDVLRAWKHCQENSLK